MTQSTLARRGFIGGAAVALGWSMQHSAVVAEPTAEKNKGADHPARVLLFSGTGWFRHPEIPQCNGWLVCTLGEAGYIVDVTETPADLTAVRLANYDVFLMN